MNLEFVPDLGDLQECLVDEDDRDENGKTLLREARDVANDGAEVEGDDNQQPNHHPYADPEAKGQEVEVVFSGLKNNY